MITLSLVLLLKHRDRIGRFKGVRGEEKAQEGREREKKGEGRRGRGCGLRFFCIYK